MPLIRAVFFLISVTACVLISYRLISTLLSSSFRLADNTYVGTFGASGYGAKANDILSKVRGKDFRHEKTKKKRGTYRGGIIDMNAVHSVKLSNDDD